MKLKGLLLTIAFVSNLQAAVPLQMDSTYLDTVFDFWERSADQIEHVANFSSNPIYTRYVCGTNENYTHIAQHFDHPSPRVSGMVIKSVELLGFQVEIIVNQLMSGADSITFGYYNVDSNGRPEGTALAEGTIISGGLANQSKQYFQDDGGETALLDTDGYAIVIGTYEFGTSSDIFVVANNYCVVPGGPNDGRAERRLKAKYISDGQWHDIIEMFSFMDCDALIYPFLRVTESWPVGIGETPSFESKIYPNPSSDYLQVKISNTNNTDLSLQLFDIKGRVFMSYSLGNSSQIDHQLDLRELPSGIYHLQLKNDKQVVTEPIVIK